MKKWTKEWPKEPGFYWFFGRCQSNWSWSNKTEMLTQTVKSELYFVTVCKASEASSDGWYSNPIPGFTFVTADGHFLYKEDGAEGVWQKINLPELPE